MALPGIEGWDLDYVKRVIDFEVSVARNLPALVASFAQASQYAEPEAVGQLAPNDAPFALMRAAELAFAIDEFDLGYELCRRLLVASEARPRTSMQYAQWATVGAALGAVRVRLDRNGAYITSVPAAQAVESELQLPWPATASQTIELARRFIPAAIATGPAFHAIWPLAIADGQGLASASAMAMVEMTDEFLAATALDRDTPDRLGLMVSFPDGEDGDRAFGRAFEVLEMAYAKRLAALARAPTWRALRIRGNLIDWGLVVLWIARMRRSPIILEIQPRTKAGAFARDLAERLVGREYALVTEPQ